MKCHLKYIGVVDTQDKLHYVSFQPGLNIITGKSSTGKSAILEIFDYCLGSSEDTIPVGKITQRGKTFFVALQFPTYMLVTARDAKSDYGFLLEVTGCDHDALLEHIANPRVFFDRKHYMPLRDFKKSIGRHFAVTLENVDEDPFLRQAGRPKSATPSVRSFMSFMLQHQNLVANKHAIFYRFEQKDKRDQAIDHFKILMGLVNEEYFDLAKQLELARYELKKIQSQIPMQNKRKEITIAKYKRFLAEFHGLAGAPLVEATAEDIYAKPTKFLKIISERSIKIDVLSNAVEERRGALLEERASQLLKKRTTSNHLRQVISSMDSAARFGFDMSRQSIPASTDIAEYHCPLCDTPSNVPAVEANKLTSAINWLNDELKLSAYTRESFAEERRKTEIELAAIDEILRRIQRDLQPLDEEIRRLQTSKGADEQAIKSKVKLELAIQEQIEKPESELAEQEKLLRDKVNRLSALMSEHEVDTKLEALSNDINAKMCELADRFDFEATYLPSALRFDLKTFDLWYQYDPDTRVYLRSMGSGANWLYSHLALFMSLHYQFSARSDCRIPPILFLDQPTQVYFPASLDDGKSFDAKELAKQAKREDKYDADLSAVTNMFTQLARFCAETKKETGVAPQIIVSDHADNLALKDGYTFAGYVRAVWRDRGFIADA